MNIFGAYKDPSLLSVPGQAALVLVFAILFWATNVPMYFSKAHAAQLTLVRDILSDSDLGVLSTHTVQFTSASTVTAGNSIRIVLDPITGLFSQSFSAATTTDITATGMTIVSLIGDCSGAASEVYVTGNYNSGVNENITFTVCAGDTVSAGAKTITIGAVTRLWTNPGAATSYRILVDGGAGAWADFGETRVAIIDDVVVTAAVNTSLSFTIAGLASGSSVNGTTTSTTTTATAISYGVLTPLTEILGGQELTVTTNASNGFKVTVAQDQHLTSSTGADIDLFKDGAETAAPTAWTAPLGTLDVENTYGHFGVTSEDSSLTGGDPFATELFAGDFSSTSPREIFMHTGPSDGSTAHKGITRVAYMIEITSLQEAGTDYTSTLTYVATPTF